jgi:hypothetical protein
LKPDTKRSEKDRTVYNDFKQLKDNPVRLWVLIISLLIYAIGGYFLYDGQSHTRDHLNIYHLVHFWAGFTVGIAFNNLYAISLFNLAHEVLETQTTSETFLDIIFDILAVTLGYLIANRLFFWEYQRSINGRF